MQVRLGTLPINGVTVKGENPLPIFRDFEKDKPSRGDGTLTDEESARLGEETGYRVLPYRLLDKYDRNKTPISLKTVVLENEHLEAIFLPNYGGRLYSLKNKETGKELLYKNPVFQPANLGIRNAWFSGGVEWNVSQYGHTFASCSSVFVAELTDNNGESFIRVYDFERTKRLFWQIDFHLPSGSRVLMAHVRIINPDPKPQSMYWWTNIAIESEEQLRVFSGTDEVLFLRPESISDNTNPVRIFGKTRLPELPTLPNKDSTYPMSATYANEYFFQNQANPEVTWSAAAYESGRLFFERSTMPLRYRKMFCWGSHRGGKRWCDYLSLPGKGNYVELQAGLAPTQLNAIDIPPHSEWTFTQAIGEYELNNSDAPYQDDYTLSRAYIQTQVDEALSSDTLQEFHQQFAALETMEPNQIINQGSGWGAFEAIRSGGTTIPQGLSFPSASIDEEQLPWLGLMLNGYMQETQPLTAPTSWLVDETVLSTLEMSMNHPKGDHYLSRLHLGVMYYELGRREEGAVQWEKSIALQPSPIALRNLAQDLRLKGDLSGAIDLMEQAVTLEQCQIDRAFSEEYLELLISAKRWDDAWAYYQSLPNERKSADLISMTAAIAAVELGQYAFVEALFTRDIAVIREGDNTLTDLFFRMTAKKEAEAKGVPCTPDFEAEIKKTHQPPYHIDFRMVE